MQLCVIHIYPGSQADSLKIIATSISGMKNSLTKKIVDLGRTPMISMVDFGLFGVLVFFQMGG